MIFTRRLDDEEATERLGEDLALALLKGDLVTLHGDLGAGKTTFARALVRTLADDDTLEVPSPTFTLVQAYEDQRLGVTHADLYRIGSPEETEELGLDRAREEGVLVVEWPERAGGFLDDAQFAVFLEHDGSGRTAVIRAEKQAAARLERSLLIRAFLQDNRRGRAVRRYMLGDASPRGYETLTLGGNREILMNAPAMRPAGRAQRAYAQTARLAPDIRRFIGIDRLLRENGFAAPEIHAADPDAGLLIMEDLGREGITDDHGLPIAARYRACAALLADFHRQQWPAHRSWPDLSLDIPAYDRSVLHAEVALLPEWYLPYVSHKPPDPALLPVFHACWEALFDHLQQAERSLVMRDFHAPNIIWRAGRKGHARIGLIDFQDALIGPAAYDLASLAQDARTTVCERLEKDIIATYMHARGDNFDRAAFEEAYAITGAQRVSKILGIFVRLNTRDGKPAYLRHLPRLTGYLRRCLKAPVLRELAACYRQMGVMTHDS